MNIDHPSTRDIPALRALWREAFGDDDAFLDAFFGSAFSPDRCLRVTLDGQTVAALYWFDCACQSRRIAYLYAIATARSHRGQGICRRLMAETHLALRRIGYEGALLVPGSDSLFAFYETIGYKTCARLGEFSALPSEQRITLRPIEAEEYATLRRTLLPSDGVVQERENLAFLRTQASLWAGDGFLLAARGEGDSLYGIELLGDTDLAPAILHTLGFSQGHFRTVGNDRPFAMYYPFGRKTPPSYFGLAFD